VFIMADPFFAVSPAAGGISVTPSDSTVLSSVRGLYVGGTGDVAVVMEDGSTPIYKAVPIGTILPIKCSKVKSTGTTATLIVALI
jgi:hypothetical protein